MAREKVDNKLNVVIGTKAQIEGDTSIPENSIIVVTDEELKADEIAYSAEKNVKEAIDGKQDKLVTGDNITIDPVTNVISASGGGGGIPEAPADNKLYGRKDETWQEIEDGGIEEAPDDGNEYVRKNSGWKKNIPVEIDANYNGIQYQDFMFLMSDKKRTESSGYEITKVYGVPVHEVVNSFQEMRVDISNFSTPYTGFSPSGDSVGLIFALFFSTFLSPLIITMYDESDNYIGDLTIQVVKWSKESGKLFYSGTFFNVIEQSMQPFIADWFMPFDSEMSGQKYMKIYVPLTQTSVEYITVSMQGIAEAWD